ncbi:(2Fe-2S) ferredoxin domain-containing protein [Leptolyngbya sp. NK1-12]|uniref:(2Fe-2S) ferredoxin domain-containing protein n=1 Tax=Leptolyngbya sp. NK1-12 TaxID=2547451 RepID=A0AA97APQ1_9CYAN|nr:(2Fe-2S) ferredoxin domain-containing protein [Leptolyngbya sp. NK1-12]WNZ22008.1 (2Fe-2S) ferredoxin domain-containing protein [Leptolyngbya sp. NK1-12]
MSTKTVLICQNTTCRKAGAAKVLAAFQTEFSPNATIQGCACLGQCGNGPMVLVMPDQVWYSRVHPDEVPTIVQQHLRRGQQVKALLYPKYHPS